MRLRIALAFCAVPGLLFAQTADIFAALPLTASDAPVVLRHGAPQRMQELLTRIPANQAAFAALARSLPQAISGRAAVLSQSQNAHGVDVFGIREVVLMHSALATSMVLDLSPGQSARLGPALEQAFGYVRIGPDLWHRPAGPGAAQDLFGGGMPGPSYLRVEGDRLIQTSDPQLLAGPSAAHPDVARLRDALHGVLPPGAAAVQIAIFLNLPDGVGLPVRMLLLADVTTGDQDGLVVLADPMGPAEVSDFIASANGILDEPAAMDIHRIGGTLMAASWLARRDPDLPPWRNPVMERITRALADGSFWRTGRVLGTGDEARQE